MNGDVRPPSPVLPTGGGPSAEKGGEASAPPPAPGGFSRTTIVLSAALALMVAVSFVFHVGDTAKRTTPTRASATTSPAGASVTPTATSARDGALARWRTVGATEVPPAALQGLPSVRDIDFSTSVPGVSPDTVTQQLVALRRTAAYETWAIEHGQSDFLANFAGDPRAVNRELAKLLVDARGHHAAVQLSRPLAVTRAALLPLSPYEAGFLRRHERSVGPDTVWRLTSPGPLVASSRWDGADHAVTLAMGDYPQVAVNGTVVDDPLLGPIWKDNFSLPCDGAGQALAACR